VTAPDDLPFVDENAVVIDAPPQAVWEVLVHVAPRDFQGRVAESGARVLGCRYTASSGPGPLEPGSTFPGFMVARMEPLRLLSLEGRHRFSRYRLEYALDDLGDGRTRLRAGTWAAFDGLHGRAYRAAVIGTRFHVLALRRTLGAVARRARHHGERGTG